jgi:hypothetical protein
MARLEGRTLEPQLFIEAEVRLLVQAICTRKAQGTSISEFNGQLDLIQAILTTSMETGKVVRVDL